MEKIKKPSDTVLAPLSIPARWLVYHNSFLNEPPLLEDGTPNRFHNDSPDLLLLKQYGFDEEGKISFNEKGLFIIDVGWKYFPVGTTEPQKNYGGFQVSVFTKDLQWENLLYQEFFFTLEQTIDAINAILKQMSYGTWQPPIA
jgi:hypothetical protein